MTRWTKDWKETNGFLMLRHTKKRPICWTTTKKLENNNLGNQRGKVERLWKPVSICRSFSPGSGLLRHKFWAKNPRVGVKKFKSLLFMSLHFRNIKSWTLNDVCKANVFRICSFRVTLKEGVNSLEKSFWGVVPVEIQGVPLKNRFQQGCPNQVFGDQTGGNMSRIVLGGHVAVEFWSFKNILFHWAHFNYQNQLMKARFGHGSTVRTKAHGTPQHTPQRSELSQADRVLWHKKLLNPQVFLQPFSRLLWWNKNLAHPRNKKFFLLTVFWTNFGGCCFTYLP